ncbi:MULTISPECIES: inorganic pyrophosphatase [Tsukamurella]|uniref:inorganic diphosphatase n=2 Tax=Tsukamurella TaxID=2060 RepID=A0A5C5S2U5_9ACTN|nr:MULTISPECIES: inorganic pyrophosphatase [Tsukamurella]NMD54862.1 inorganic pyrophosphatase [Tsukamurella columbiensis]TWS29599.1 inorganic pyrophosphatase [Tsukamurella conjunctivitidis]
MRDTASDRYFLALDEIVRGSEVVIDRPRGSAHPRYPEVVYPLDYGYLAATIGGDGDGIDVFVGSATGAGVVAVALTSDPRKRDTEIKVLIDCGPDEVEHVRHFLRDVLDLGGHIVSRGADDAGV